ncbi:hypothetical protein BKA70DRAFT_1310162 [Coprinopsis sp. MPI-PUGE-AT-0042]|nr:hypothetical protein BKA70DRAFT_1310162 [Coprinopsis sp. MPI-PUGE-AT-0042]
MSRAKSASSASLAPYRPKLPPELVVLIMAFALGDKPFSDEEYKTFACFRSVCREWNGIADSTRNLCRGLELNLFCDNWSPQEEEGEEELDYFHKALKPWFALVANGRPYHLRITADSDYYDTIPFLRSTNCGTLSVLSDGFFDNILRDKEPWPLVTNVTFWGTSAMEVSFRTPAKAMDRVFPQLKSLSIIDKLILTDYHGLHIPFRHDHLQSLHLHRPNVRTDHFASFLIGLRGLKEIILENGEESWDDEEPPFDPIVHPHLERVILMRCPYIKLLSKLTFPALQHLHIQYMAYDTISSPDSLKAYLEDIGKLMSRSEPKKLTFSLRDPNQSRHERRKTSWDILTEVGHIYTLHLHEIGDLVSPPASDPSWTPLPRRDLQEIVCQSAGDSTSWRKISNTFLPEAGPPIKVYLHEAFGDLPKDRAAARERIKKGKVYKEESREAREKGFDLQFVSKHDIEMLLYRPIRSHSYLDSVQGYERVKALLSRECMSRSSLFASEQ